MFKGSVPMKKILRITAFALAFILVFVAVSFKSEIGATDATIEDLRADIDYYNDQLRQLEEWQEDAENEKTAALKKIQGIDAQKVVLQKQIDASLAALEEIDAELARLDAKLKENELKLEEQHQSILEHKK